MKDTTGAAKVGGDEAETLALNAFAWILAEDARASRFIALTGAEPAALAAQLGSPGFTSAVFTFLMAHEPDLVACAEALALKPEALAAHGARLNAWDG
jgi:hypothetical protein